MCLDTLAPVPIWLTDSLALVPSVLGPNCLVIRSICTPMSVVPTFTFMGACYWLILFSYCLQHKMGTVNLFCQCCYLAHLHICTTFCKITERIEYKLLSLTYKVLTTTQPPYLHNLISVQPPRSTRSSSLVTLARPPTSSSLRITDGSFRYASPCLWNQLHSSLRQPHSSPSVSDWPVHAPATSSYSLNLPLSPSITPCLFHSHLKIYLFLKSFPP